MGTRGAIGFVINGEWKVTYNHYDSYPEGLGMDVLEFCKSINNWEYLKVLAERLMLVDSDSTPQRSHKQMYAKYADTGVGNQSLDDWYCLLRNIQGAKTLYEITNSNLKHIIDNHMFLADSLFCEWAYIIDLDEMGLRVYKGFNEKPYKTSVLPPDIDPSKVNTEIDGSKYYPVKLLYTYSLDNLPEFMLGVTNEFKKQYRESHLVDNAMKTWLD
jgi:hypothetical protein